MKGMIDMALNLIRRTSWPSQEKCEHVDFGTCEMDAQMDELRRFRDEGLFHDEDWDQSVESILNFQLEDGSFGFDDPSQMPSDARVDYVFRPSYACCQVLMRYLLEGGQAKRAVEALGRGLTFCCTRHLMGHGYKGLRQQLEDVGDFVRCGALKLERRFTNMCPEFFALIESIGREYEERIRRCDVFEGFGEYIAVDLMRVSRVLGHEERVPVFVYGTLLTGMSNASIIAESSYLGEGVVEGFTLYDLGSYPGIRHSVAVGDCESMVYGEVRLVDFETLESLNRLEGEGCLYTAERVRVRVGKQHIAAISYVYRRSVDETGKIPDALQPYCRFARMRKGFVWYVSYGSNILYERFMCYIGGGRCRFNGRVYPGCDDATPPLASMIVRLPYPVYFGNDSSSWDGSGVAFLDLDGSGDSLARAYLITREQFEQIHDMEGRGASWYPDKIQVDTWAGIPVVTFTNRSPRPRKAPSEAYLDVMRAGLREAYFAMNPTRIDAYLEKIAGV